MRSTHTFSVDFTIRRCKGEKEHAHIYARITVDGELPKEISLKDKIIADDWDNKAEIVRGRSIEAKTINANIDEVRTNIKAQYKLLQQNHLLITAETVKDAYLGINSQLKGHKLKELCNYFKTIWEEKLAPGNFKNYKTTIDYIHLFLDNNFASKDIYLSQLNNEFATNFEYYIRNNPIKDHDPCKGNGVGKHIQRFKRILNWGANANDGIGWMKTNPCEKYSCPVKKNRRKKLNMDQLVALELKHFKDPTLNYVRDLFLFSCYTGFAFADVMQLNKSHFVWDTDDTIWCQLYRTKSEVLSPVPLLKDAARLIEKYRNHPDTVKRGAIFPLVSNKHVNECLKVIGEICEIEIDLTFHLARHTFAKTVALKNGIPLETVQVIIGHTKITTTQIYAEVDEEKIKEDFAGLDDKLNAKRKIVIMRSAKPLEIAG